MTGKRSTTRVLFPQKLWELVNKPQSGIEWSSDGQRILVDRAQLEKFAGTKFRSQNFDSFIRQLHFYGFRKSGNSYHHALFQRGKPEVLHKMRRKYSNKCFTTNFKSTNGSQQTFEFPMEIHAIVEDGTQPVTPKTIVIRNYRDKDNVRACFIY